MKKILVILILSFIGTSASADSEMTLEKCSEMSQIAGIIMTMRQEGSTMAEVFVQNAQAADNNKIKLLNDISKLAYNSAWTKYSGLAPVLQRDEILDFQNFIFIECFDTIPQ